MVVEVPPTTDLVSGVLPDLHLRQSGLTLTLGGVEHPFGLHLASEDLVSWSVRPKLCQICPLCIANNFPRHMDWQASCRGDWGLCPELNGESVWGGQSGSFTLLKFPFHGIVLPKFVGVVMLNHTYLAKPAMTWHIRDSLCGGDATRSLECGEEGAV